VKRFAFSLESARRWRNAQLVQEEAKYRTLALSEADVAKRIEELSSELFAQRKQLASGGTTDGTELALLHSFGEYVAVSVTRLESERKKLAAQRSDQSKKLIDAKRRVELLVKLKEKESAQWKREFENELQSLADEAFNARLYAEKHGRALNRLRDHDALDGDA
jgi:hypothetical protein